MIFHIEGNSKWASKLNNNIMKCHEKFDSNTRSNILNSNNSHPDCKMMDDIDFENLEDKFFSIIEDIE